MSELTLDEAIKHCEEVAEKNENDVEVYEVLAKNHENTYSKLTAIKYATDCAECAADHRQLAEWLMELKDLRAEQNEQYVFIRELMDELKEAKRLLKAAVEDFAFVSENFINNMDSSCSMYNHIAGCKEDCPMNSSDEYGRCKWRHMDEALKLIGDEPNGI